MNKSLWSLLLVAALPGCLLAEPLDGAASGSAGNSPSNAGAKGTGESGATGASGATGRGGATGTSGASNSGGAAAFLGTWTATSGTLTITCPGTGVAPSSTDVTGDTETWTAGSGTDLVLNGVDGSCNLTANVSGRTATGSPGQTCTDSGTSSAGDSYSEVLAFEHGTFVISSDGTTATQTLSGADVYTDKTKNITLDCVFTESATYAM